MQVLFWIPITQLIELDTIRRLPKHDGIQIDWSIKQQHPSWIQISLSVDDFIKFNDLKILNHYETA